MWTGPLHQFDVGAGREMGPPTNAGGPTKNTTIGVARAPQRLLGDVAGHGIVCSIHPRRWPVG